MSASHQHSHFPLIQHVRWFGAVVTWIVKAGGCEVRFNPLPRGPWAGPSLPRLLPAGQDGRQPSLLRHTCPAKRWNTAAPGVRLSCQNNSMVFLKRGSAALHFVVWVSSSSSWFFLQLLPVTEPGALGKRDWPTFLPRDIKPALKFAGWQSLLLDQILYAIYYFI